jgi:hypothetical protein
MATWQRGGCCVLWRVVIVKTLGSEVGVTAVMEEALSGINLQTFFQTSKDDLAQKYHRTVMLFRV